MARSAPVAELGLRWLCCPHPVERADGLGDGVGRDCGVACGGIDPAVAEQFLDEPDIGAVFQQVGGETVAQGMDGDALVESGGAGGFPAGGLQRADVYVAASAKTRKQIVLRLVLVVVAFRVPGAPPAAQNFQ